MQLDQLREVALANFEILLDYWGISFRRVLANEYDILATWRQDTNFGSVRFNTEKGRGADFAATGLTDKDYANLGPGFDKGDFAGFSNGQQSRSGFDIIGLCQRVRNKNTPLEAQKQLENDIREISTNTNIQFASAEAAERRRRDIKEKEKKLKIYARDLWESCKYHPIRGSVGELYLTNRGIGLDDNVRFHPGIYHTPTKTTYPALIFKVQIQPDGPLIAVHRIFIDNFGNKADVPTPKMALAPVKGGGIWFGKEHPYLAITEGPENALSLIQCGYPFVVSTIYGTNFHNITIPKYVRRLYLVPDIDRAGLEALERAENMYNDRGIDVIPMLIEVSNPKTDINDLIRGTNG